MDELQALLIGQALAPHERDFNLDLVYGAEAEAQDVLALCAGYPVMAERRVVIVRDFDKLKQNRLFATYAEHPNPQTIALLLCSSKPNLSAHPYRALKAFAVWSEFKPLHEKQMPGWIQKRVEIQGYRIEPEAVGMLAEYTGNNMQAAVAEIEKLTTYAGERKSLTASDVLEAGGQTREFNVFELQRMIGEQKYPEALRIAERLLQQASNPRGEALMIVSVLSGYFTKLWKLTACQARRMPERAMAERVGISPFFIKEYLFSLRRFKLNAIEGAFTALLAADFELKGGASRDERLIMTLLLRRLTGGTAPESRAAAWA